MQSANLYLRLSISIGSLYSAFISKWFFFLIFVIGNIWINAIFIVWIDTWDNLVCIILPDDDQLCSLSQRSVHKFSIPSTFEIHYWKGQFPSIWLGFISQEGIMLSGWKTKEGKEHHCKRQGASESSARLQLLHKRTLHWLVSQTPPTSSL